jgi:uncharacterized protein YegP (UPF0339 family)
MTYVLLFLALNSPTPAQLGTYNSEHSCQSAIRQIYETKATPRGVVLTPQMADAIQQIIDVKLQYQREYTCVKQG